MEKDEASPTPESSLTTDSIDSPDVFIIRRHPIGIILVYVQAVAALLAITLFTFLVFPEFFKSSSAGDVAWLGIVMIVVGLGVSFFLLVATYIYNQNRIIVTSHDVEQIIQRGLLVRKNSRLELSDVEDVAVSQKGLLPTLFGYGTLTIQTAGALENFVFPYCINPNYYAYRLLQARGRYIVAIKSKSN